MNNIFNLNKLHGIRTIQTKILLVLFCILNLTIGVNAQSWPFGNVATRWQCENSHMRQFPNQPGFSSYMAFTMVLFPNGRAEVQGSIQTAAGTGPFKSLASWQHDGQGALIVQGPMEGGTAAVIGINPPGGVPFVFVTRVQSQNYLHVDHSQQGQGGGVMRTVNQCQLQG